MPTAAADFIKLTRRHDQKLYYFVHELLSNGPALMEPIIDWCKSGLSFIRDGVPPAAPAPSRRRSTSRSRRNSQSKASSTPASDDPPSSSTRFSVDYDALLSRLPEETQLEVLTESRRLATWTHYKKAFADLQLRCDLLVNASDRALMYDPEALYADLLRQDWDLAERGLVRPQVAGGRNGSDSSEWQWYAPADGGLLINWERVEKLEREVLERGRKEKKGLFRTKSGRSTASSFGADEAGTDRDADADDEGEKLRIPEPRVVGARELIDAYVEAVTPALKAARENNVR